MERRHEGPQDQCAATIMSKLSKINQQIVESLRYKQKISKLSQVCQIKWPEGILKHVYSKKKRKKEKEKKD